MKLSDCFQLPQWAAYSIVAVAFAATAIGIAACQESPTDGIPDNIFFPQQNVSFARHVQPLFDASCAVSGCHDNITQAGLLDLTSYFVMLSRPGLITPFDSSSSVLAQVMSQRLPHLEVPITLITNYNQRIGVSTWIHEGARNN